MKVHPYTQKKITAEVEITPYKHIGDKRSNEDKQITSRLRNHLFETFMSLVGFYFELNPKILRAAPPPRVQQF
jgi:hypothetical protein